MPDVIEVEEKSVGKVNWRKEKIIKKLIIRLVIVMVWKLLND